MSSRKNRHPLFKAFMVFGLLVGALGLVTFIVFGNPRLFFSYSKTDGRITFYANDPIPEAADRVIAGVEARLHTMFDDVDIPEMAMFVTGRGWRSTLFFLGSPRATGVVYYPLTRNHGFLRGADFTRDQLIRASGPVPPPRSLTYFATHEFTHVLLGQMLGVMRFHQLPRWVAEGLPDYVAMGGLDRATYGAHGPGQKLGYYAQYRLLVTWFLEHEGWRIEQLLATDLSLEQAIAHLGK